MAKNTQRVVLTIPNMAYRRAKQYARSDYGGNMSQLFRVALAEFMEKQYGEDVVSDVDWGGWREGHEKRRTTTPE